MIRVIISSTPFLGEEAIEQETFERPPVTLGKRRHTQEIYRSNNDSFSTTSGYNPKRKRHTSIWNSSEYNSTVPIGFSHSTPNANNNSMNRSFQNDPYTSRNLAFNTRKSTGVQYRPNTPQRFQDSRPNEPSFNENISTSRNAEFDDENSEASYDSEIANSTALSFPPPSTNDHKVKDPHKSVQKMANGTPAGASTPKVLSSMKINTVPELSPEHEVNENVLGPQSGNKPGSSRLSNSQNLSHASVPILSASPGEVIDTTATKGTLHLSPPVLSKKELLAQQLKEKNQNKVNAAPKRAPVEDSDASSSNKSEGSDIDMGIPEETKQPNVPDLNVQINNSTDIEMTENAQATKTSITEKPKNAKAAPAKKTLDAVPKKAPTSRATPKTTAKKTNAQKKAAKGASKNNAESIPDKEPKENLSEAPQNVATPKKALKETSKESLESTPKKPATPKKVTKQHLKATPKKSTPTKIATKEKSQESTESSAQKKTTPSTTSKLVEEIKKDAETVTKVSESKMASAPTGTSNNNQETIQNEKKIEALKDSKKDSQVASIDSSETSSEASLLENSNEKISQPAPVLVSKPTVPSKVDPSGSDSDSDSDSSSSSSDDEITVGQSKAASQKLTQPNRKVTNAGVAANGNGYVQPTNTQQRRKSSSKEVKSMMSLMSGMNKLSGNFKKNNESAISSSSSSDSSSDEEEEDVVKPAQSLLPPSRDGPLKSQIKSAIPNLKLLGVKSTLSSLALGKTKLDVHERSAAQLAFNKLRKADNKDASSSQKADEDSDDSDSYSESSNSDSDSDSDSDTPAKKRTTRKAPVPTKRKAPVSQAKKQESQQQSNGGKSAVTGPQPRITRRSAKQKSKEQEEFNQLFS